MTKLPKMQPSFVAGELSPSLAGRVDLAKFNSGAKTMLNFLVHPHGGASNRPGTRYIGEALGPSRLIPFTFSVEQAYALEFSEYVMRVLKDGGFVLTDFVDAAVYKWTQSAVTTEWYLELAAGGDPGLVEVTDVYEDDGTAMAEGTVGSLAAGGWDWGDNDTLGFNTVYVRLTVGGDPDAQAAGYVQSIYQAVSPYAYADLAELKFTQSADTMYFAHPSYAPRKMTRTDHDAWTFSTITFAPVTTAPSGLGTLRAGASPAPNREVAYKVGNISAGGEESLPTDEVPQIVSSTWISGTWVEVFWNDLQAAAYKWTQVGATDEWYLELAATGDPSIAEPQAVYERTATGTPNNTPEAMTEGTVTSLAAGEYAYAQVGATFFTIFVRISTSADPNLSVTYPAGYLTYKAVDDYEYNVYKSQRGFFGWAGTVSTPWFIDDNIDPDVSLGPQQEADPFPSADNYPGAVGIYEQRLVWGRTNNAPQTIQTSQTGLFENASISSPIRDSDAISVTIASRQTNEIRHLVPLRALLVLTSGSEWTMSSGTNSDAVTPTSIRFDVQGYRGSSQVPPLTIGNEVLFLQRNGTVVRNLAYAITDEGYTGADYTVLAGHLFEARHIIDWAYQQDPDSTIWCVTSDGIMLGFTYLREHEVWAWHRHTTDGTFESICSIEGDDADEAYMLVNRTIDGSTVRYVEQLAERLPGDFNVRDSWFVDSGLQFSATEVVISGATQANPVVITTAAAHGYSDGDRVKIKDILGMTELNGNTLYKVANKTATDFELNAYNDDDIDGTSYTAYVSGGAVQKGSTVISGLDHLEGKAVAVLADGNVVPGLTVASGAITLPNAAVLVTVGLPYTCDLETLQLEINPAQTIQNRKRKLGNAFMRLRNTRGGFVGPNVPNLVEIKYREDEDYYEPTELFTGDKKQQVVNSYGYDGRLFIRQSDPLPITVLAIIPEMVIGG